MNQYKIGISYTVIAYVLWGILPLYWKLLEHVPASEILAHRIVWSFLFVLSIIIFRKRYKAFIQLLRTLIKHPKKMAAILLAGVLVSGNWFIYIWAVNTNHLVEASLGYYINPLLSVLLGVVVLREKLSISQMISVLLAAIGVMILTIQYGQVPWIAISLALSFALYGLAKKLVQLDSMFGLAIETSIVTPIALIFLGSKQIQGTELFFSNSVTTVLLLIGCGIATAIPLLCFAEGVKRIPLSMNGFFQYIAPTISLLIGVFLFQEEFTKVHLASFMCIWFGLIIYTVSNLNIGKQKDKKTLTA
ncbi:EamA family transporter RarD [Bacillus solimangrovi]|uniref:Transporter n=1 Tax=Bacillus solimangrovi TaxID=1305675 RepID=A0A1E5LC37_9BACI|nr:EamA family transporter RarD [Bacillus solimangrovi]OEH91636.1 transporter [Bacillus solimangrovi]